MKKASILLLCSLLCVGCASSRTSARKIDSTSSFASVLDSFSEMNKDETIQSIYQLYKANGGTLDYDAWLKSIKGEDGNSLLTGKGVPSNANGKDGDSYIDTTTWDFYSKSNGKWTKVGNIHGTDGKDGTNGKDATEYVPAIFKDEDGNILYEKYYAKGTDIVYDGPTPTKTVIATDGTFYSVPFLGWDTSLNNIQKPTVFTAKFLLSDMKMLRKSFANCDYYLKASSNNGGSDKIFYYQNYWFTYRPSESIYRGYILYGDQVREFTITPEVKDGTTITTPASITVNSEVIGHNQSITWTNEDFYSDCSYYCFSKTFSFPRENELIYTFKSNTYSQGIYYTSDSQKVSDDLSNLITGKSIAEVLSENGYTFDSYYTQIILSSKTVTVNGTNEKAIDKANIFLGASTDNIGFSFDFVFDGHTANPYHNLIENKIQELL